MVSPWLSSTKIGYKTRFFFLCVTGLSINFHRFGVVLLIFLNSGFFPDVETIFLRKQPNEFMRWIRLHVIVLIELKRDALEIVNENCIDLWSLGNIFLFLKFIYAVSTVISIVFSNKRVW